MPKISENNELLKQRIPAALERLKQESGVSWYRLQSELDVSNGHLWQIRHGQRLPSPMQQVRLYSFAYQHGLIEEFIKALEAGTNGVATVRRSRPSGMDDFTRMFRIATSGR